MNKYPPYFAPVHVQNVHMLWSEHILLLFMIPPPGGFFHGSRHPVSLVCCLCVCHWRDVFVSIYLIENVETLICAHGRLCMCTHECLHGAEEKEEWFTTWLLFLVNESFSEEVLFWSELTSMPQGLCWTTNHWEVNIQSCSSTLDAKYSLYGTDKNLCCAVLHCTATSKSIFFVTWRNSISCAVTYAMSNLISDVSVTCQFASVTICCDSVVCGCFTCAYFSKIDLVWGFFVPTPIK